MESFNYWMSLEENVEESTTLLEGVCGYTIQMGVLSIGEERIEFTMQGTRLLSLSGIKVVEFR